MSNKNIIWFILGTILLVVLYSITFGKVDLTNKDGLTGEDKRQKALEEKKRIEKEIGENQIIKNRVQRNRKIIYFIARLIIVGSWFTINILLYFSKVAIDLSTLVMYNEIFIIILIALIYLFIGNLNNLKEITEYFKNVIENRLYRNKELIANNAIAKLEIKKKEVELNLKDEL